MTKFLKEWKTFFTFAALLSCFVNILQLTFPFYMFTIYRNVVVSYSNYSLANITFAACYAIFSLGIFSYLRARLLALAGKKLTLAMRTGLFYNMVRGAVVDSARAYRGGINDLETLQGYFSSQAVYSLFDAPWSPFYLGLVYLFHPVLGMIATAGALVMIGLSILQEILVRKSMTQANIWANKNLRFVDSFLRNVEVINGMGMISAVTDRFMKKNSHVMENQTRSSCHAGTIQALIKPLQNVIQVAIYCAGAWYAMTENFNVGMMVAASIIMGRAVAPLMRLMSTWRMTVQAREAYLRLQAFSAATENQKTPMPLPKPTGRLEVAGAVFRTGTHLLLKGISFKLCSGEFLGIIGPSGAGKTTLCRLLLGAWPSMGGKVYLDGKDIFLWNKEELGAYIGYLPQEIELFPGTVAQNIARLGRVDKATLEKAVVLSGAGQLIDALPEGLDTQVEGESEIRLSGGQKQKIGLARALYGDPVLLVLDEPTSNLDELGEQQLMAALNRLKQQGCTCIMVTHKPELLQSMDTILVVKAGQAAMLGPKDQVFAKLSGAAA